VELPLFVAVVELLLLLFFAQFAHSIPSGFCFYPSKCGVGTLLVAGQFSISQTAQTKTMTPPPPPS